MKIKFQSIISSEKTFSDEKILEGNKKIQFIKLNESIYWYPLVYLLVLSFSY